MSELPPPVATALPVHVVLVEPEIPNNTGSVGRTCVAVGASLHLVHPLAFDISEKACRRAGLDYWPRLSLHEHESWATYRQDRGEVRAWSLTTRAQRSVYDVEFAPGDHLVFGRESAGLAEHQLESEHERRIALPMMAGERSLNLSNCVAVVLYEVLRQFFVRNLIAVDGIRIRHDA